MPLRFEPDPDWVDPLVAENEALRGQLRSADEVVFLYGELLDEIEGLVDVGDPDVTKGAVRSILARRRRG
jgi:hypothetical protein